MESNSFETTIWQPIYEFWISFLRLLFYTASGCIKAILPLGVLPRKSVKDEYVLITGSGNGIGRLLAIEFAKLGANIILWDIDEINNYETKKLLSDFNIKSYVYTIDLSKREQIYETAEKVLKEVGKIDILINNAGIVSGKKLFECPDVLMEKTMAVNAHALFYTSKAFLPNMIEANHGHIVTVASMAGYAGVNGLVDYTASKYAAVGFSEALRSELITLGKNIPVTTICPYYINTGMFDGVKTFSPLMFPILETDYAVERMMEAILTNSNELFIPKAANLYLFLKGILPSKAIFTIIDYFGLNRNMDHFVGRNKR